MVPLPEILEAPRLAYWMQVPAQAVPGHAAKWQRGACRRVEVWRCGVVAAPSPCMPRAWALP
eukprot:362655-Chlamydomonas_euryale.AAC.5